MITLKIKDKEYKLKFGYKSFKKSGILREVTAIQQKMRSKENEKIEDKMDMLEEVMELTSRLVMIALQKNHEEFRVEDYGNEDAVNKKIDMVDDLLDDYTDEEEFMPIMDLFSALVNELFENGFLSKKSEKLEESLTEQDATIVPIDHKRAEN